MLAWISLVVFILLALVFDLRRGVGNDPSLRRAIVWSCVWLLVGIGFAGVLVVAMDGTAASEYLAGFLIEKSLSLDNLFVFSVLFTFFAVPDEQRQRVLEYGIIGAIVLRALFIFAGAAALEEFHETTYVLGAILALTAIKIARQGDGEIDPNTTLAMRTLRKLLPLSDQYDGERLTIRDGGKRVATPLLAALLMVAAFDVMFAIDSIPAIFAITQDTFIVFAANAFSLLGMVSLFFLLEGMLDRFVYLNYGLAAILGYVAAKLILVDVWHPSIVLSLAVVVGSLLVSGLASAWVQRGK